MNFIVVITIWLDGNQWWFSSTAVVVFKSDNQLSSQGTHGWKGGKPVGSWILIQIKPTLPHIILFSPLLADHHPVPDGNFIPLLSCFLLARHSMPSSLLCFLLLLLYPKSFALSYFSLNVMFLVFLYKPGVNVQVHSMF
jgi:hypothetical protein